MEDNLDVERMHLAGREHPGGFTCSPSFQLGSPEALAHRHDRAEAVARGFDDAFRGVLPQVPYVLLHSLTMPS